MQDVLKRYRGLMLVTLAIALLLAKAAGAFQKISGLIVEEVVTDSVAARAGLKPGDYLLSYDGKPLASPAALQAAQQNMVGKEQVALSVRRGEEMLTLTAQAGRLGILVRPVLSQPVLAAYMEGKAALKERRINEAVSRWKMAAEAAQEGGDKIAAAWLYARAGESFEEQRGWKEAQEMYLAALQLSRDSNDVAAQSRMLSVLGQCSQNLNDFPAAQRWFEQARQVDEEAGAEMWVASDLGDIGRIVYFQGKIRESQVYFKQALAVVSRLAPDSLSAAACLNNLGNVARSLGNLQEAHDYYTRTLAILDRLAPDSLSVATCLHNLGILAYSLGHLEEARSHSSRALAIRERLAPDSLDVASSLSSLGNVARSLGDLEAAEDHFRRALAIRERLAPGSLDVAASFGTLGNVARAQGDLLAAMSYYCRSLIIFDRLAPNSLNVAASLLGIGNVSYFKGDHQAAADYYNRALAIHNRIAPNSLDTATCLNNLGNVARSRDDLESAKQYFSRALKIREQLAPNSLDVAASIVSLGNVAFLSKDLQGASYHYNRALTIFDRLAPNSLDVAASLANLGFLTLRESRPSDALPIFNRAVDIVEAQRSRMLTSEVRALLVAQYIDAYSGLLRTHLALNDLPAAFATVERAHARSLVELLAKRRLNSLADVPRDLLKQQDELDYKRDAAYATLAKLDSKTNGKEIDRVHAELTRYAIEQQELEARIHRASPRFAALRYPKPFDLNAAQAMLDTGTLLLAFYVDENETYLFAITRGDIRLFKLPVGEEGLNNQVAAFRNNVAVKRIGQNDPSRLNAVNKSGHELYQTLIAPAQELVDQAKRIIICPDGPLHTMPFAALVSRTKPRLRYLIEEKPLHMIVSMTVYAETRKLAGSQKRRANLLAFGDPVYMKQEAQPPKVQKPVQVTVDGKEENKQIAGTNPPCADLPKQLLNLDALPRTREEVGGIGKLFGKVATIKLDQEATETTAKQESKKYSILHFAVHGKMDEQTGLNSGLALSQPEALGRESTKDDDGLLQAWEILGEMRLNADLVVLSGCETGLGQRVRGEGLIGLTQAFQYAGARSVVTSLWEVNDASTATLMTAFYQELNKGTSKDIALQRAMRTVRTNPKWQHPFFWSPFILVGDWQ